MHIDKICVLFCRYCNNWPQNTDWDIG